jgi:hypothetical protein
MPKRSSTPYPVRPARKPVRKDGSVIHSRYTPELAEKICERIAGGEIWWRICSTDGLPSYRALYQWAGRYPEFAEALAQAREIAAHARFDKALVVAEDSVPATVQSDRLHVSTLLRHAEALGPDHYDPRRRRDMEAETTFVVQQYRRDPLGGPAIPIPIGPIAASGPDDDSPEDDDSRESGQ